MGIVPQPPQVSLKIGDSTYTIRPMPDAHAWRTRWVTLDLDLRERIIWVNECTSNEELGEAVSWLISLATRHHRRKRPRR